SSMRAASRLTAAARMDDEAREAFGRVTTLTERARYAPTEQYDQPTLRALPRDLRTLLGALAEHASRANRIRAAILPSSSLTRLRERRELGRALGRAFAWYEWVLFVLVFPLALVIYWVFRLLCGAFDARIPPPRRGVASPSFRVGASWRTAPWFPPEMIWKLQPPGIEPGVLRRLLRRLTRRSEEHTS